MGRIQRFRPSDAPTGALDWGTTFNQAHDRGCAPSRGLPRLPSGACSESHFPPPNDRQPGLLRLAAVPPIALQHRISDLRR